MSEPHRLDPLLKPRSIAVLGASTKAGSLGNFALKQATVGGSAGPVWPVNPNYAEVEGLPCYGSLRDLPTVPEHIVMAVPNARVEETLAEAIAVGARSATIFASCYLPGDTRENSLTQRIARLAGDHDLLICGGNCLGYLNLDQGIRSTWFPHGEIERGSIGLVAHSGSVFVTMTAMDARLGFNYVISAGQEISVTAADYLDFLLDQRSTRCVGLFLEAVREPVRFLEALEKANRLGVPVVALKVGRTSKSAALARTHSGAIAGDDAAYEAVFERYGVARVSTLDEFSATLQVLAHPKRIGSGRGIVALHDSGGERGMAIDLAADFAIPYAEISQETVDVLSSNLEFGLEPVNPLDIWGTGNEFDAIFRNCFSAMMRDPDSAIGILFSDLGCGGVMDRPWGELTLEVARCSEKPIFIAQNLSRMPNPAWLLELTRGGVPVIDGTENMLKAAKHALGYQAFRSRSQETPATMPERAVIERWRTELSRGTAFDEATSLALFADFGLSVPRFAVVNSEDDLAAVNAHLTFPLALKTAVPELMHKSDADGVVLGIEDLETAQTRYRAMASRLGSRALVAEMAAPGAEFALGMYSDAQFGPLVVAAGGGIWIEVLKDRAVALPPIGPARAEAMIRKLRSATTLDGLRGKPKVDLATFAQALSRFSHMVAAIGDLVEEIDANPIIVSPSGAMIVDGLVVPKAGCRVS